MKKITFAIFICLLIFTSCTQDKDKVTKSYYSALYTVDPETYAIKDTIHIVQFHNYENGSLKSREHLYGFTDNPIDTFEKGSGPRDEIEGKYTYHYENDKLTQISCVNRDTIFYFDPEDLSRPQIYKIKKDDRFVESYLYYSNTKQTLVKWLEYSENQTIGIFKKERFPDKYLEKDMSDLEINNYIRESREYYKYVEKFEYW